MIEARGSAGPPQPHPTSTSPVWRDALAFEPGEVRGPTGELYLFWRLDEASDPAVDSVTVAPDFGGVGRGSTRNDGWRPVPAGGPVHLLRGGPAMPAASGVVPAGSYQHVFVAARSASATGTFGAEDLTAHVEPIARALLIPAGARVEVDIILIVLRRPNGGIRQLFVKDAVMREDVPGPGLGQSQHAAPPRNRG